MKSEDAGHPARDPECLALKSDSDPTPVGSPGALHRGPLWPSRGIYFKLIFHLSQRKYLKPNEVNCREEANVQKGGVPAETARLVNCVYPKKVKNFLEREKKKKAERNTSYGGNGRRSKLPVKNPAPWLCIRNCEHSDLDITHGVIFGENLSADDSMDGSGSPL